MKKLIKEKRLVSVLVSFLRSSNHVTCEVRHYEKYIDVVAIPFSKSEILAIEVKTSNWGKAFQQAVVNLAVADKSYVAIYDKCIHRVNLAGLDKYGIGLISVGSNWGEVKIIQEAQNSLFLNKLANIRIKDMIMQR